MCLLFTFIYILCVTDASDVDYFMVDMSYVYDETTIDSPMWRKFELTVVLNGTVGNSWMQGEEMTTATHMGTHIDSPSRYIRGGLNTDQIPISKFIAPAAVINIESRAAMEPEAQLTVEDLENWEIETGQSLDGTIVLVNFGWGKKWPNRAAFLGTYENDVRKMRFPGISREAAEWLVDYRQVVAVGTDTVSIDIGSSRDFPAHKTLLGSGMYVIENIANLDKIPAYGATLYVMPMKIGRASGAPTRIIATFPKDLYY